MKHIFEIVVAIAFFLGVALCARDIRDSKPKQKEFNWAIQGELSHQDCGTQSGTRPWYVDTDPTHRFFMGCR